MSGVHAGKFARSQGILHEMEERDLIVFMDDANFAAGASIPVRALPLRSLGELWDLVEASYAEGKSARECGDKELSRSQVRYIKGAFNALVKRYFKEAPGHPDREWYAKIDDPSLFVWDPARQEWSAMRRYAEPALITKKRNDRYTAIGALETALELAVSHGRLSKPDPNDALQLPASDGWLEFSENWAVPFKAKGLNGRRSLAAHLVLSTALEIVGPECPHPTEVLQEQTDAFLAALDSQIRGGACNGSTATSIRKIMRRAYAEDLLKPEKEDHLKVGSSDEVDLVIPRNAALAIAEAQLADDDEWEKRIEVRGSIGIALFDEEDNVNLGWVLDYQTAKGKRRSKARLPAYGLYPDPDIKTRVVKKATWDRAPTIAGHLGNLAALARIVSIYRTKEFPDPKQISLTQLLTLENVLLMERALDEKLYAAGTLRNVAVTVGLITCPGLEYRAWQLKRPDLMKQFRAACNAAYGEGYLDEEERVRMPSLADTFQETIDEEGERSKPDPDDIEDAFKRETGHDYAYNAARHIENVAERYLLHLLGLESWDDMTLELALRLKKETLKVIQGLALWQLLGMLPFRLTTILKLEVGDRVWVTENGEARIRYQVEAEKFKSGEKGEKPRAMDLPLPAGHDTHLMEAYLTYVRPLLLQKSPVMREGENGEEWTGEWVNHSDYLDTGHLWVADTSHKNVKICRIGYGTPNKLLREILEIACEEEGWDYEALHPFVTTHCHRHKLGTFYVNALKDPKTAADLLHHVDTDMVNRKYSAKNRESSAEDAMTMSKEMLRAREAREARANGEDMTPEEEIAFLKSRIAEIEAREVVA